MKKRFLDVGLYTEALRQLRMVGITAFAIWEVFAILLPIISWSDARTSEQLYTGMIDLSTLNGLATQGILVAPLMMLVIFRFLNHRSASDLYHALPATRTALFLSFFAAVMTWLTASLLLTSATSFVTFRLFPSYDGIDWLLSFSKLFRLWVNALFLCSCVAVGMSLTGTLFTNLAVTGMLLLFPGILRISVWGILSIMLPIMSGDMVDALGPFSPLLSLLSSYQYQGTVDWLSLLSTLVLSVVYLGVALWLFCRRKSEAAGQAAPNRGLQAVFRLIPAALICLAPCAIILNQWHGCYQYASASTSTNVSTCVIIYIIAVAAYFLYELITTRKWRNLPRAIPGLAVLLAFNLVFIGGITGVYHGILAFEPSAEEIRGVRVISTTYNDYVGMRAGSIELTDPVAREEVAGQLSYAVDVLRKQSNIGALYEKFYWQTVEIRTDSGVTRRRVPQPYEETVLLDCLMQTEVYQRLYFELPDQNTQMLSIKATSEHELSHAQTRRLYALAREELAGLDTTLYPIIRESYHTYGINVSPVFDQSGVEELPVTLYVSGYWEGQSFQIIFTPCSLLPKTCAAYYEMIAE